MKKLLVLLACGLGAASLGAPVAHAGTCSIANLDKAIREVAKREPNGAGTSGECDPGRYNVVVTRGAAPTYAQLVEKVRAALDTKVIQTSAPKPVTIRTRGATNERCFGAVGPKCDGALPFAPRIGTTLYISVGSILHDNCCLAYPNGSWCTGIPNGLAGRHDGNCVKEWDKATTNSAMDGRHWRMRFSLNEVPNLGWVRGRTARFQSGGGSTGWETVATSQLKAPRGTALDPGDADFCETGRAREYNLWGTPKRWIICE